MLEARGGPNLLHEAIRAQDRSEFGLQDFDSDLPLVFEILRQVHGRHAARAELAFDAVSISQSCSDPFQHVWHRTPR
jgi:hypothetical protein